MPTFAQDQFAEQQRAIAEAVEAARLRDEATGVHRQPVVVPVRVWVVAAIVFIGLLVLGWVAILTGALPFVPA